MPSFFQFTQGTESRIRPNDSSPLLGRFRAVPPRPGLGRRRSSPLGLLSDQFGLAGGRGSVHVGYGALIAAELEAEAAADDDNDSDGDRYRVGRVGGSGGGGGAHISGDGDEDVATRLQRVWKRWIVDLWVHPRASAVKRMVDRWWSRYGLLVFLPAILVCLELHTHTPTRESVCERERGGRSLAILWSDSDIDFWVL